MFVRVALDTSTVRNHTDNCQPQLDLGFIEQNRDKVRISLTATAFVELTRQLADGDLPYADWQNRIPALNGVLDQRWPCLPNGKQLAWFCGTQIVEPIENIEDFRRNIGACWFHLLEVKPNEIGKCKVCYRDSAGTLRAIQLDLNAMRLAIDGPRDEWIKYIDTMKKLVSPQEANEKAILKMMSSNFGTDPLDAPGVAEKLDAVSRMIARFVTLAASAKVPYNPKSNKRKGDAFDINMLFYIPLPAVIVTNDKPFALGLRETKAPTARQVITIDEFNRHLRDGTLESLVSDFQTPDRQFQKHRDGAYSRWEDRGRRLDDDLADWFSSEPIA